MMSAEALEDIDVILSILLKLKRLISLIVAVVSKVKIWRSKNCSNKNSRINDGKGRLIERDRNSATTVYTNNYNYYYNIYINEASTVILVTCEKPGIPGQHRYYEEV